MSDIYNYFIALVFLILYCIFKDKYETIKKKRTLLASVLIIVIIAFVLAIIYDNLIIQICMLYILTSLIYNVVKKWIKIRFS